MSDDRSISIALCTYNGALYIEEQLASIFRQTLRPLEIVVVDDCSTDATVRILRRIKKESEIPIRLYVNRRNVGVIGNFEKAVGLCRGDYVALCDQDDVWLPEKLAIFCKEMTDTEAEHGNLTPILVYSDLRVADRDLGVRHESFNKFYVCPQEEHVLETLIVQNFVTGCVTMLNRPLIMNSMPIPEEAVLHDYWFALIAATTGRIRYIPVPTVLYRQHSQNVTGVRKKNAREYLTGMVRSDPFCRHYRYLQSQVRQLGALVSYLDRNNIQHNGTDLEEVYRQLTRGGLAACIYCLRNRIYPQLPRRQLAFFWNLFFSSWYRTFRG